MKTIKDFEVKQAKISKSMAAGSIKKYSEKQPELKEIMNFWREILGVQKRHFATIYIDPPNITKAQMDMRIEEGRPLIDPAKVKFDKDPLKLIVKDIVKIIGKKSPSPPKNLSAFIASPDFNDEWIEDFFGQFIEGKEKGFVKAIKEANLDRPLAGLVAHTSIVPFYWRMAQVMRKRAQLGQITFGFCPVCGSRPIMGFLRPEDGLRVLECSLCSTRWGTPRMNCLFCGSQDQNKLKYHFAEGEKSRRLYVCENCLAYLKVSEIPAKSDELVVPLEDFATSYLDKLAEEKGYKRVSSTVFS